ncbi:protein-disulfide reductase DsbD domain-containing protein [Zobellia sp. 1_MG-2023]|uniref:protein-disulfide reductase DsbD domain-containing protein n=1 Tax=Zobellia sp. 1_MG-2023 TaxID=3062626 RepID=UPI0026E3754A|nr:protein-disulfide reductase DsbD domain-containing protein [Zobellia sp. 1_MG-2023]MDO6817998.1 protein-disulfide reductase DsbD family protein [Zobellia sp. 1_MG-2023]
MKKAVLILVLLVFATGNSQILEPVKWSTKVVKISDKEYDLMAIATIDAKWHLYSQTVPEDGPIPTTFLFKSSTNYLKKGNTKEEEGHTISDPVFNMEIKFFETKALFKQRILIKEKKPFKVNATVEFMVCDDSRCLPPTEVDLVFNIK